MGKLHELLAVEAAKKTAFHKVLQETAKVFSDRAVLFTGWVKTLRMFSEDDKELDGIAEQLHMTSTVKQRLDYLKQFVVAYFDVVSQKEITNQSAAADLVLDDDAATVLAKDVPATLLLGLEQKLAKIREVFDQIPTTQAGIEWVPDKDHEFDGVYKAAHDKRDFKTRRVIKPFELFVPTKDDPESAGPAQIEKLEEVVNVGEYVTKNWSGMYTPAQKSAILARIDHVIESCKIARMKANEQTVEDFRFGEKLMSWIIDGK